MFKKMLPTAEPSMLRGRTLSNMTCANFPVFGDQILHDQGTNSPLWFSWKYPSFILRQHSPKPLFLWCFFLGGGFAKIASNFPKTVVTRSVTIQCPSCGGLFCAGTKSPLCKIHRFAVWHAETRRGYRKPLFSSVFCVCRNCNFLTYEEPPHLFLTLFSALPPFAPQKARQK